MTPARRLGSPSWRLWGPFLLIAAGTAVTAVGIDAFYAPNRISDGGVAGVGIILLYLLHVPLWLTLTALNLPLLWLSHHLWGGRVGVRTMFGTLMLSLWVGVFSALKLPAVTHNTLLAAIYGGILSGSGLGLVFRAHGTTGGTDVLARFLSHVLPVSMGQGLLAVDFVIISAYGLVFNPQAALYSLIALFLSTRAVDLVQEGIAYARAFTIISDRPDAIARAVLEEMDRGLTRWGGEGVYTGQPKTILFVLVSRAEVSRLKELVYRVDPRAFVVVGTVHEVIGEGFRRPPAEE